MDALSLDTLPLGFRFRPSDEELIDFYLRLKINGNNDEVRVIREVDICKWEPSDLPDLSVIKTKDMEWFFFCPLDRKYPNGSRLNRATEAGYWKATGKDRKVKSGANLIGMKKTLVFYIGRAPKGTRTNWVMHEYRATEDDLSGTKPGQSAFVLIKLFKKQDQTIEGSNPDEVEPAVSSPTAAESTSEDIQPELKLPQVSPVLERQSEKHHENTEASIVNFSGRTTSDTLTPVECHSNSCNAYDVGEQAAEVTAPEMDPQLEELNFLPDIERLDHKIFSPLHRHMQAELGSFYPVISGLSNNHSGVQFQDGTNDWDNCIPECSEIGSFYEFSGIGSFYQCSDDYSQDESVSQKNSTIESETPKNINSVKHSGSCGESYAEVGQAQLEGEYPSPLWYETNIDGNTCMLMETTHDEHSMNLGSLQNESQKDIPSSGFATTETCNFFGNCLMDPIGMSDISGPGIRTRSHHPVSQPRTENSAVIQGDAPRRVRLQISLQCKRQVRSLEPEYHEVMSIGKEEKGGAGVATNAIDKGQKTFTYEQSGEGIKIFQDLRTDVKPGLKSEDIDLTCREVASMYSKAPSARRTNWSYGIVLRGAVVAVAFLMSICTWRFLKV